MKFLHVPYRGAAPALTDLLGGQVQVVALDMPVVIAQIQAGNLVPIGDRRQTSATPLLPDVPTLAEQGYPNTDASNWYALLAPAKTPPAVIAKLNKAVNDALNDPAVHDKLVKAGATPVGGTPEALGDIHEGRIRQMGPRRRSERHQGAVSRHSGLTRERASPESTTRIVVSRFRGSALSRARNERSHYPGRYSPVFGSGFNFGSASRSSGSAGPWRARRRARC